MEAARVWRNGTVPRSFGSRSAATGACALARAWPVSRLMGSRDWLLLSNSKGRRSRGQGGMNSSGVSSVDIDDDDDSDVDGPTWYCVDCGASSPKTRTAHTLISSKHGWRLARIPDDRGGYRFEWRCPGCWSAFKQQGTGP